MRTSDDIAAIAAALAKAQGELTNPKKGKTAQVKSDKGSYSYRYASLDEALPEIRKVMSKHNLAFAQATELDGDLMYLTTRLIHGESGQWFEGIYPVCRLPIVHQQIGSAVTYARRYALFALIGVAGEEDDTDAADAPSVPGVRSTGIGTQAPASQKRASGTAVEPGNGESLARYLIDKMDKLPTLEACDEFARQSKATFNRLSAAQQRKVIDAMTKRRALLAPAQPKSRRGQEPTDAEIARSQDALETLLGDDPSLAADAVFLAGYEDRVEQWEQRLRDADPATQAEIWETEIEPFRASGHMMAPDVARLERILRDQ